MTTALTWFGEQRVLMDAHLHDAEQQRVAMWQELADRMATTRRTAPTADIGAITAAAALLGLTLTSAQTPPITIPVDPKAP